MSDLKQADMVLLGVDQEFENDSTVNDIRELYRRIQTNRSHRLYDEYKVAEITKIAVNCFSHNKD